jgi:hypothetical protein
MPGNKKAFDNFYRRVREGARKKGHPRFKKDKTGEEATIHLRPIALMAYPDMQM